MPTPHPYPKHNTLTPSTPSTIIHPTTHQTTKTGKMGKFPEPRARFYSAEITLALEHIHKLDIVYRCVLFWGRVDRSID